MLNRPSPTHQPQKYFKKPIMRAHLLQKRGWLYVEELIALSQDLTLIAIYILLKNVESKMDSRINYLQNGRIRYIEAIKEASRPGEMMGRRLVHEFNPLNGRSGVGMKH